MPQARMRTLEAWRVLGLPSAPTVEAVKQAYRGLAKSLHPDAVGGAAKPAAFARLTEAYEVALNEASAANRHGETRPRPSSPPPPRQRSAPRRDAAPREPESRGARPRATPGSTTYDGAGPEDGDQPWDGAGWVGADSGTYWRVNPKEYADPRKHGAEYRARGKRPVRRDRSEQRSSHVGAAYATEEERGLVSEHWPSMAFRLFYALIGFLPWLALQMSPLAIGAELLLLGLFLLAPRAAWAAAHGTAALLFVAAAWLTLGLIGLPLPEGGEAQLTAGIICAAIYLFGALLAAAGRIRARPWHSPHAG
ncbi:MAG: J domain-containing protein [Chloroflexi bacterium]|nr:MAG: J domain-containing protein [Chloroflexota bacterium]